MVASRTAFATYGASRRADRTAEAQRTRRKELLGRFAEETMKNAKKGKIGSLREKENEKPIGRR